MEASALHHSAALAGRSPLLRLQSDERLIALIRRGNDGAFDALFQRYQSRLLAFCRHMLGSTEDAEDVLQEVFAAAYNALLADNRAINARPWLYRIARNRCLNHLRRPVPSGQDSMDIFVRDGGATTADTVHKRQEFRELVADVQELPETQRTALLLREIDALSYDQIAEAMDTTVPSVKSLLVRARVSLAEAAEARLLTCEEARYELGRVAEGLARSSAPVRRHVRGCDRCRVFKGQMRKTTRALASVYPLGPLVILKKLFAVKLGFGAAAGAGSSAAVGGSGAVGGAALAGGSAAGGMLSAGLGTIASKATAGLAAAAIVTAGAVEIKEVSQPAREFSSPVAALQQAEAPPPAARPAAPPARVAAPPRAERAPAPAPAEEEKKVDKESPKPSAVVPVAAAPVTEVPPAAPPVEDQEAPTVTLPPDGATGPGHEPQAGQAPAATGQPEAGAPTAGTPPGEPTATPEREPTTAPERAPAAPPAGEPAPRAVTGSRRGGDYRSSKGTAPRQAAKPRRR